VNEKGVWLHGFFSQTEVQKKWHTKGTLNHHLPHVRACSDHCNAVNLEIGSMRSGQPWDRVNLEIGCTQTNRTTTM